MIFSAPPGGIKQMDPIDRNAALNALDGEIEIRGEENARVVQQYVRRVSNKLRNLPSAQPEQQWIPCSEKLPEKACSCLVAINKGNEKMCRR